MNWCLSRKGIMCSGHLTAISPKTPNRTPNPIPDDIWRQAWLSELTPDDRLWLGLGYFIGLRRYEIVTVSPQAFDKRMGTMRFDRKGGSTETVDWRGMCQYVAKRLPWVAEGIEDWMVMLSDTLTFRSSEQFLWPHSTGNDYNDCQALNARLSRKILPAAGLRPDAFTPHRLRHSCATNLHRCDLDSGYIAKALSHSNVRMTAGYMDTTGYLQRLLAKEEGGGR
jgi:integrase